MIEKCKNNSLPIVRTCQATHPIQLIVVETQPLESVPIDQWMSIFVEVQRDLNNMTKDIKLTMGGNYNRQTISEKNISPNQSR